MTERPPSAPVSSGVSNESDRSTTSQNLNFFTSPTVVPSAPLGSSSTNPTASGQLHPYTTYSNWSNAWSSNYSGYTTTSPNLGNYYGQPNPYTSAYAQQQTTASPSKTYNPYSHLSSKTNGSSSSQPTPPPPRIPTPPLPEPETYKHWEEVIKRFFEETKLIQALKGLEADILVLNCDWEQKVLPDALRALVSGLQVILDRISGKRKADEDVMKIDEVLDITTMPQTTPKGERSLDERKLDYVHLSNGKKPQSQSSINKSISQFLANTRARNDASNRAEFLYTLAEKKRKLLLESQSQPESESGSAPTNELTSCARVDAKPIDRDNQMKYDIAKNDSGPLSRTKLKDSAEAETSLPLSNSPASSISTPTSMLPLASESQDTLSEQPRKKRRLTKPEEDTVDITAASRLSAKAKGKAKEDVQSQILNPGIEEIDTADPMFTAERLPGLEERVRNIEEHLAVRYVPSPPRTLVARLKYLEDHLVKLEKEYPPWAALHFNQPNRGWPPPPRATPIIVPPNLRSSNTVDATNLFSGTSINSQTDASGSSYPHETNTVGQPQQTTKPKGKKNSSLHKAVLDRLEVQKAKNEIDGRTGQGVS